MSAIVDCKHFEDGRQVPCPPMCPTQSNPMRMKTWLGRWLWLKARADAAAAQETDPE